MHKNDQEEPTSNDPTKPWEKQFEDERDDDGNLSRLATRKKHRGTTVLTYVLWTLIALFVLVPVTLYAISSNSGGSGSHTTHIAVESEKSSSSKKPSSSSKASEPASESSSQVSSSAAASVASSSSSATAGGTYTVKAGDNAYRIALNHGMTLAEFYQLNGQGTLVPGQQVKVK